MPFITTRSLKRLETAAESLFLIQARAMALHNTLDRIEVSPNGDDYNDLQSIVDGYDIDLAEVAERDR